MTWVFIDEAAEDWPALDPFLGEVGGGVVGPRRVQLVAAVGPASVAVGFVLQWLDAGSAR
jgi:hypothetical protein